MLDIAGVAVSCELTQGVFNGRLGRVDPYLTPYGNIIRILVSFSAPERSCRRPVYSVDIFDEFLVARMALLGLLRLIRIVRNLATKELLFSARDKNSCRRPSGSLVGINAKKDNLLRPVLEDFRVERKTGGAVESKVSSTSFLGLVVFLCDDSVDLPHELVGMRFSIPLRAFCLAATSAWSLVRARFGSVGKKDIWKHRLANLLIDFVDTEPLVKEAGEHIFSYGLARKQRPLDSVVAYLYNLRLAQ